MDNKKLLIGFYSGTIEKYAKRLEEFEENNFLVYVFDNIDEKELINFNIKDILINILGENYAKNSINIISNIEKLILDLYQKHSYEYNGFIYDNSINLDPYNKDICINNSNLIYNFNLYSIKRHKSEFDYIELKDTNLYFLYEEMIDNYLNTVSQMIANTDELSRYYDVIQSKSEELENFIYNLDMVKKNYIKDLFSSKLSTKSELIKIYIYSFLLYLFKEKQYSDEICNIALSSKILSKENRFFIMYQLVQKAFPNAELSKIIDNNKLNAIYDKVFLEYKEKISDMKFIPKKQRNKELVFVFISQFLITTHGPTKTVLDRCYSLIKDMNKRVILINTKEFGGMSGIMLMNSMTIANVIDNYEKINKVTYKGIDIPFYQPSVNMPNESECINIVNMVKKYKPYLIFNIGGYSITADLCSQIVPVATISTSGNYSISKSKGQFFIMGRKATQSDYEYIAKEGHTKESIIECPFTFDLKPQKNKYTRKDFGIPSDKFIVTAIGGRLQYEIDEEYIKMIDELSKNGCFFVSIGNFKLSESLKSKYKNLKDNIKELGFQEDVLACIDLTDIYLNPKRQGGGTSAVECMFKGKPALSLNHGDVSMLVNEEFLVNDYNEMIELTLKLKNDNNFYKQMADKAREKSKDLMDTKKYFTKAYEDIISSTIFQ